VRNSHDSFMVDYWTRRDKGKKERDVNEFSREENAPVNCCTLYCAVRAQLLCVSNLGVQRLVRAFFVPLYQAFCMGKQVLYQRFLVRTKKEIPGTGHFSALSM